jgi:hypothetical protein
MKRTIGDCLASWRVVPPGAQAYLHLGALPLDLVVIYRPTARTICNQGVLVVSMSMTQGGRRLLAAARTLGLR